MSNSILEQAIERARGNAALGTLLAGVVSQYITPVEDPLYDWQIKRLTDIKQVVETRDAYGQVWRTIPDMIECREFVAPIRQCALAWGTRMVPGSDTPSPLAVLVWATKDEHGQLKPLVGASFYFAQNGVTTPRWFTRDRLDVRVADAITHYLNNYVSGNTGSASTVVGVDLGD